MHAILPKRRTLNVKKTRRKQLSALKSQAAAPAPRAKSDAAARSSGLNIHRLSTLDAYKRLVAKLCTEATSDPENNLEGVLPLFDIVAGKGGGTDELKAFASKLALRSLVAVAVHLLPRISYELIVDDDEYSDEYAGARKLAEAKNAITEKLKSTNPGKVKRSKISCSNLVATERAISKQTKELLDRLVEHCQRNLAKDPELIVPLIARLTSAEVRPNLKLIKLCVECCNNEDEALSQVCIDSLRELFNQYSIRDLEKTFKVLLKGSNINVKVLKLINAIPLAKRQHSFELMSDKKRATEGHVEEILCRVVAFYLRILGQCSGEKLEECLTGLSRFGALVNEPLQREILDKMKSIIVGATSLRPSTHVRVLQSAASLSRILHAQSHWILQELTRMVHNTAPYLYQGQIIQGDRELQFATPCHTWDVVRTVQKITSQATCSGVSSEMEELVRLVQELLSLCVVCDTAVAQALIREVEKVIERVPPIAGLVDADGMVFSVLAKRATNFWEIELLSNHVGPNVAKAIRSLRRHASGAAAARAKGGPNGHQDIANCGSDVYEMLTVNEDDLFVQYKHKT
ncbi:Noc3p, putative [Babesia ovis]|uniref:Noc3p, putative n=1 Tax=Babesia ovis TaxID=5869 RepID=A0A9W5WUY8_BABOV|nr:Noc3p, putative [Babesia ovis]